MIHRATGRDALAACATNRRGLLSSNIVKPTWELIRNLPADFADGQVSWNEVQGVPGGLADGKDDEGITGLKMKRISSDPISFVSFDPLIGSSYYRALPTTTTQWDDPAGIDLFAFRQPRNWLVEVVLVRECMPLQGGEDVSPPPADPCAWRHAWYYGVQSDDTVTLPFEEVDPD